MSKESYLIESLTRDLTTRLMEEKKISMIQALDIVYTSKTYQSLSDPETGLYFQSSVYLFDLLETEINKTKEK